MKSREIKQKDLEALTSSLQNSTSAMVVSFNKLTVVKDMEFRDRLREAGAEYRVVKNTLARIAVKGTDFEQATESFKGVTAIAWTDGDPVILSKAVSKFMKDNADHYSFKSGVVDGRLVDLQQLTTIANLPSKEELISKLLFVINAQAQRLVTVINAVPRDLAIVIKQIGDKAPAGGSPLETKADVAPVENAASVEDEPNVDVAPSEEAPIVETSPEATADDTPATEESATVEETPTVATGDKEE
jgi:large subunit ribosomal protein L10